MNHPKDEYKDILNHPHHVSTRHPQMSRANRAAQFAPFAALTGYDDLVEEAARFTNRKHDLDIEEVELLNQKLMFLLHQKEDTEVAFNYFVPDEKKSGGKYVTVNGYVAKFDAVAQVISLIDGTEIPIADILKVESDAFHGSFTE